MTSPFRGLLTNLRARFGAAGVPFAIGGSFATAARGYVRATQDLDVMLMLRSDEDWDRAHRAMQEPPPRFIWINEANFRDEDTRLLIELLPVRDEAQHHAFETATLASLHGAEGIRVLTTEGIVLMLLRQATLERLSNLQRIADIENLARRTSWDWGEVAAWAAKMGYHAAYGALRIEAKPPLPGTP